MALAALLHIQGWKEWWYSYQVHHFKQSVNIEDAKSLTCSVHRVTSTSASEISSKIWNKKRQKTTVYDIVHLYILFTFKILNFDSRGCQVTYTSVCIGRNFFLCSFFFFLFFFFLFESCIRLWNLPIQSSLDKLLNLYLLTFSINHVSIHVPMFRLSPNYETARPTSACPKYDLKTTLSAPTRRLQGSRKRCCTLDLLVWTSFKL